MYKILDGRGQYVEPVMLRQSENAEHRMATLYGALAYLKKLNLRYFFAKVGYSYLNLCVVTWSGKVYVLMAFQRSGA